MMDEDFTKCSVIVAWMKPYHVRPFDNNVPWQQCLAYYSGSTVVVPGAGMQQGMAGIGQLEIEHSEKGHPGGWRLRYNFMNPGAETPQITFNDTMLLDEVDKKWYFFHSSPIRDSAFIIQQTMIEIEKMSDGSRKITHTHSSRPFLGCLALSLDDDDVVDVQWFLNSFDGSIFQIDSCYKWIGTDVTTFHTFSWIELDDEGVNFNIDDPKSFKRVKVIDKCKVDFAQYNCLDLEECGILFSEGGKKFLVRFRMTNPDTLDYGVTQLVDMHRKVAKIKDLMTSVDSPFPHQMSLPPTYALFGLDYHTCTIQLLTKLVPSSQENHADLLISAKLLPTYAEGIKFPNSKARSYLSQRSLMIGQFLKYTFFSTVTKKDSMAIVAVKSLTKTLQNGQQFLAPKKVWFPMEDDRVKMAFKNLSEKIIKWDMLAKQINVLLVSGNEFILQVRDFEEGKGGKQWGTIRVKLGAEYKDYRNCAGCGMTERHKRRSKNGKRISQFKVCGWCKDHNLHKMWWEVACHYCSEECANNHWPTHRLEHNIKHQGKKGRGKKKSKKNDLVG